MGHFLNIDAGLRQDMQDLGDDLITELGKDCRLVYSPRLVACANCVWSPALGRSANVWKTGGPLPFGEGGPCPLCDGRGRQAQEVSETVKLLCVWEPKNFYRPVPELDLRVPYAVVQTKGFLSDLPKILKCDHLELQAPLAAYGARPYKLAGEPGDPSNLVQGRWFVAVWNRSK